MSGSWSTPGFATLAEQPWDILVIGGGITGAGIMREAARLGKRVLLVEKNDFASGTSSRSAKMVHGGLHYLARGQFGLAHEAVRERERLIRAGTGLVDRQGFMLLAESNRRRNCLNRIGLGVYDLLAGHLPGSRLLRAGAIAECAPGLSSHCHDALAYGEATIDDARLVLCVIRQGCLLGGHALNYVEASTLVRGTNGRVNGAVLRDRESGLEFETRARVVVNATGPWADGVRGSLGAAPRLRLVRGSHLVFPGDRLPVKRAIATRHPDSHHPVCVMPWEGMTLVGTTSVEHTGSLDASPRVSSEEVAYLLRAVRDLFPEARLEIEGISTAFAGVRAIVDHQTRDAAKASRDYAIWEDDGLVTVAGGKLTTFHPMALKTLRTLGLGAPERRRAPRRPPVLETLAPVPSDLPFDAATAARLHARYGPEGLAAIAAMPDPERRPIGSLRTLWGELRWAARAERVRHLDDLLLRRVRIGLTGIEGGLGWSERIRAVVQAELDWGEDRWQVELERYRQTWQSEYGVPELSPSLAN